MDLVLEALKYINPSDLTYTEWVQIGMALKEEGYPCSAWDEWSRNDRRYKEGECYSKWDSFRGGEIKGGTIVKMAKDRGMSVASKSGTFDFDYEINESDKEILSNKRKMSPSEQLIKYLETLFKPDEYVGYVTDDYYVDADGKYKPKAGMYKFTQKQIVESLKYNGDDIGASVGDYNKDGGAWIRFNPLDGAGVSETNVTRFDYALVECEGGRITLTKTEPPEWKALLNDELNRLSTKQKEELLRMLRDGKH